MAQTLEEIKGSGPPTEETPGAVGQIYIDTETALRWECIESHHETRYKGTRVFYDWKCRGLDPDFLVNDADVEKLGSAAVKLNILETICENVTLTDDNPVYEFPTPITLDPGGLYLLDYKYYSGDTRDPANDICGLGANQGGEITIWGSNTSANAVFITDTEVVDTWRGPGAKSVFSIYKVERVIVDPVQYSAASLEGYGSIASGAYAHAEGLSTAAVGTFSHAEGTSTVAAGDHSHVEGFNTIAMSRYQHVQGSYNIEDAEGKYAHIVGNGPDGSTRSNAHTLDWDGNAWFAGNVYVGGTDQSSGEVLATKKELNELEFPTPLAKLVTLSASKWDADTKTQTVMLHGILADESVQLVIATPLMTSAVAYNNAGISLTGRGENTVTFTAKTIPAEDIKLYVVRQEIKLYVEPYLTFSSPEAFSMTVSTPGWNGTMEYSTDASSWSAWDGSEISAAPGIDGYALYFRGTGNTGITRSVPKSKWVISGTNVRCEGNIENLLDYATVKSGEHPTMATFCYDSMFNKCTALTTAPALPATTLTDQCYHNMFYGCTGLTTAPALPATTLATGCYSYMFYGCTGLTTAPALPATTLAAECYHSMFSGCTALTTAPALPATTLVNNCYEFMFNGCTGIKLSDRQTEEYTQAYRIPESGTGSTTTTSDLTNMFSNTGGTLVGTPKINTTYYLHKDCSIVR